MPRPLRMADSTRSSSRRSRASSATTCAGSRLRDPPSRSSRAPQWIAVALAFAGLVLIVAPWHLTSLAGSLLAVSAGAVWAIAAVLSKRWPTPGADPLLYTAWQLLFGFIALAILAFVHPHDP